jgi:hypothetical protein
VQVLVLFPEVIGSLPDSLECGGSHGIPTEQHRILHTVLDVRDATPDRRDEVVEIRAELADVVVFLGLRIQNDGLKKSRNFW